MQRVPHVVELVDRERLVVHVVEESLQAGVAHRVRAARGSRLVRQSPCSAVVDLHRAPRVVDVAQEVAQRLTRYRGLVARLRQQLELVAPAGERAAADVGASPSVRSASSEARLNRGRLPESLASPGAAPRRLVRSGV